jgi:hypothetical protein
VAVSPDYRYECQALFLTGKAAVTVRSPTYREIGVKREITVSWIRMLKLKYGQLYLSFLFLLIKGITDKPKGK